jgi:hypothetical protein
MHAMTGPPAFTLALAAQGITFRMGRRNGRGFAAGLQGQHAPAGQRIAQGVGKIV